MTELTLQDLRKMGGQAVLKKYGKEHYAKLGRMGAEKKKQIKKQILELSNATPNN